MARYRHTCMSRGDGGQTVRAVLDRIRDKWTLLIAATLDQGSIRFTELHPQIAEISRRMPPRTLRNLERDGLVSGTVHAEIPPRVEYTPTPPARASSPWRCPSPGGRSPGRAMGSPSRDDMRMTPQARNGA